MSLIAASGAILPQEGPLASPRIKGRCFTLYPCPASLNILFVNKLSLLSMMRKSCSYEQFAASPIYMFLCLSIYYLAWGNKPWGKTLAPGNFVGGVVGRKGFTGPALKSSPRGSTPSRGGWSSPRIGPLARNDPQGTSRGSGNSLFRTSPCPLPGKRSGWR